MNMANIIHKITNWILRSGKAAFGTLLRKNIVKKKHLSVFYKIKTILTGSLSEAEQQLNLSMHLINHLELKLGDVAVMIENNTKNTRRVSILILEVNFKYFSGGYLGIFHFAKFLKATGYTIRFITSEYNEIEMGKWKNQFRNYPGLENIFDDVEISNVYYREKALGFFPDELVVATSIWTAQLAHQIMKKLKREKFIFLIQEYETLFFASGSNAALSEESYSFPHHAIFSTEILTDYFKENALGVFAGNIQNENYITFKNAILRLEPAKNISSRKTRKLLFYFRPEEHAARNMYEFGFIALKRAIQQGGFDDRDWQFFGMGSLLPAGSKIPLAKGKHLEIIPKTSLREYERLLPGFDLGLSLMLSPHPSLVPIEMCAAGMITVTNTFANKTEEELKTISGNFVCARPTITSIKDALLAAVAQVEDFNARIGHSKVNWPTDWNQVFDEAFYQKLQKLN